MVSESAATLAAPQDVRQTLENLGSQVETLERELSQALDVWRGTLQYEREQFAELLRHKELAWQEQESQWENQKQEYRQRIEELQNEFESRLKQTEQNAVRSLNDLEDSWQRDKLNWGPDALKTDRHQLSDWTSKKQHLDARIAELEAQIAQQATPPMTTLRAQLSEFQSRVASLQSQQDPNPQLLDACLSALDCQIDVLFDLIQNHSDLARR